ncbi:MAG: BTAD domain-containing putative transcriptional regulator, partial [Gemmatimonadota bacterium]
MHGTLRSLATETSGRQKHRLSLLAVLALAPGQVVSRDRLMAHLWPESEAKRARALLNQAVYRLRKALGDDAVLSVGDELRLGTDRVDADVVRFEAMITQGDWAGAVALYVGPLMDGFFLGGAPAFDEWLERERGRLARTCGNAVESLAHAATAAGDGPEAVAWWQVRAGQDPFDSRIALHLMHALASAGNPAGALRHARAHMELLEREFGIPPPTEVTELTERLRAEGTLVGAPMDEPVEGRGRAETAGSGELDPGPDSGPGGAPERPVPATRASTRSSLPRRGYALTAVGASLLGAASFWLLSGDGDRRWLEDVAIPEIEQDLDVADWESAFAMARRIEDRVPDSRALRELWPRLSWRVTLESEPSGARVFRRAYDGEDDAWTEVGRTPLVDIRVPYG